MPFKKSYCSKDCKCSLCRELREFKSPLSSVEQKVNNNNNKSSNKKHQKTMSCDFNENFILKKRQGLSISENALNKIAVESKDPVIRNNGGSNLQNQRSVSGHKLVIYFGDSIDARNKSSPSSSNPIGNPLPSEAVKDINKSTSIITAENKNNATNSKDLIYANRLCEEIQKQKSTIETGELEKSLAVTISQTSDEQQQLQQNKNQSLSSSNSSQTCHQYLSSESNTSLSAEKSQDKDIKIIEPLPSFIESIKNGVINIRIEGNYEKANQIVKTVSTKNDYNWEIESQNDSFDWSFVQEWRKLRY